MSGSIGSLFDGISKLVHFAAPSKLEGFFSPANCFTADNLIFADV
jgi:hypothetical protein